MLKYRRFIVLVLIIAMASVFFISCGLGLPVYLSQTITGEVNDNTIKITIKSDQDIDLQSISFDQATKKSLGPSLVLFYGISDTKIDFTSSSNLYNLNSSYRSRVDEYINYIDSNTYEVFKYSDISFYLFNPEDKFNMLDYHLNLYPSINNNKIDFEKTISFDEAKGSIIIDNNNFFINNYNNIINNKPAGTDLYLYVFACVTATGSYGYFSDLSFLGSITI